MTTPTRDELDEKVKLLRTENKALKDMLDEAHTENARLAEKVTATPVGQFSVSYRKDAHPENQLMDALTQVLCAFRLEETTAIRCFDDARKVGKSGPTTKRTAM